MIRCSKCDIEKPDDQYATYFHSTQNKWRTRKVCKPCFNQQKRKGGLTTIMKEITQPVTPEPPTIDYSTNHSYYLCIDCNEYKLLSTDFYLHKGGNPVTKRCKECQRTLDRQIADERRKENGGSLMIPQLCNVYFDNYQRENTFELMRLLGYLYDEETGIWHKPGWKEIVDGKPVFVVIKEKNKFRTKNCRPKVSNEELIRTVVELRNRKQTYDQISRKLSISTATIRKCLLEYEQDRTHQGG